MPTKRLLDARRSRKALPRGFGWIDHRLLRDGYLGQCSPEALALYVLLVCAADAQGLSFYSDARIAQLLALAPPALSAARRQLMALGLIAYQKPLYQLLSLEGELTAEPAPRRPLRAAAPDPEPPPPAGRPEGLLLKAAVERLLQQLRGSAP
jgi:hypothetical protein